MNKKIWWGLFFLLIGSVVITSSLGLFEIGNMFSFLITVFLIPVIFKSIITINFSGILIPLAIIGCLYSEELNINNITPMPLLLTSIFLSIGLTLIFGSKKHRDVFSSKKNTTSENDFDIDCNFNSTIKYIDSDDFKGGMIDCSFGAAKVYFNKAKIKKEAIIDLDLSFCGVELYIPKNWEVVNNIKTFAGGIDEKNKPEVTICKLILNGEMNFSGITIIYI